MIFRNEAPEFDVKSNQIEVEIAPGVLFRADIGIDPRRYSNPRVIVDAYPEGLAREVLNDLTENRALLDRFFSILRYYQDCRDNDAAPVDSLGSLESK
jgi:hypothetical protein